MKRILIIDDDPAIREVFELIFQRVGFDVTLLANGRAIMEGKFAEPDIFLIDKQLLGIDGLDICRYLKSRQGIEQTPVIIFSASPLAERPALEAGADDFLEKPVKMSHLLKTVHKHLKSQNL